MWLNEKDTFQRNLWTYRKQKIQFCPDVTGTISSRSTGHAWDRNTRFRLTQWLKIIHHMVSSKCCCIIELVVFSHCVHLKLGHRFHAHVCWSLLWSCLVFDENLGMHQHVSKVCRTAYFHLHKIARIRNYLNHRAACTLIHAFITSHIDYCNSLLYGIPSYLLNKLQRVQNSAARLVLHLRKYEHITPALVQLHWLPVKFRINFKVLLTVFKVLNGKAPKYIEEMITVNTNARYNLRSADNFMLKVSSYKCKTFGGHAFPVYAPRLWNTLHLELRLVGNINLFKQKLKTYLFTEFVNSGS